MGRAIHPILLPSDLDPSRRAQIPNRLSSRALEHFSDEVSEILVGDPPRTHICLRRGRARALKDCGTIILVSVAAFLPTVEPYAFIVIRVGEVSSGSYCHGLSFIPLGAVIVLI
jgi:hypothetical protein